MSIRSSSSSNSSNASVFVSCFDFPATVFSGIALSVTRAFLLLPLSLLVLYLGLQRWQQRCFTTTSHTDIFTYNVAALELIGSLGCVLLYYDPSSGISSLTTPGYFLITVCICGQNYFHILTCVERYLAVVHPVTYMGLRQVQGLRIRTISTGCIWLLSFVLSGVTVLQVHGLDILVFVQAVLTLVVVSFCSLSVLCALIGPGPREGAGHRKRVDQSQQRAFNTILAITGVLWLWFVGILVSYAVEASPVVSLGVICLLKASSYWFNLPVSLVSPLLFLHREGKLPVLACCCYKRE